MKTFGVISAGLICVCTLAVSARADYMFSGSGTSGTLSSASETWQFNADGGAASTGYLNNWGSPGVGSGVTAYGETSPAYGLEITFTGGGAIDPASITIGNDSACQGSTGGGTTFCNYTSGSDVFEAFLVGPDTIDFLAQSATYDVTMGEQYFVNIFFDGATPTAFTGSWLTSFTPTPPTSMTPEPSSMLLLGTGLLGIATKLGATRRKSSL